MAEFKIVGLINSHLLSSGFQTKKMLLLSLGIKVIYEENVSAIGNNPVLNQDGTSTFFASNRKYSLGSLRDFIFQNFAPTRIERMEAVLAENGLLRKKASSEDNNCLLDTLFQQISRLFQEPNFKHFVNFVRARIEKEGQLSINDDVEGIQILSAVKEYLHQDTGRNYVFNMTVLLADNEGEIGFVDMEPITNALGNFGEEITLRMIVINYNHYEPLFEIQRENAGPLEAKQEVTEQPKVSLGADLFSEYADQPGIFIPKNPCKIENFDPNTSSLMISMEEEDTLRFHSMMCAFHTEFPSLQLQMAEQLPLPPKTAVHVKQHALKALLASAEEESKAVQNALHLPHQDKATRERLEQEVDSLEQCRENLNQKRNCLEEEKKALVSQWNQNLKSYYEGFWKFFSLLGYSQFDQKYDEEKWKLDLDVAADGFFQSFKKLREIDPQRLAPFYPILTLLSGFLDKVILRGFLEEAKNVNSHETYAIVTTYIRLHLSYPKKIWHFDPVAVLEVLKEVYPEDLLLPILQKGIDEGCSEVSLNLSSLGARLVIALNALNEDSYQEAIRAITRLTPLLAGDAFLDRYSAASWLFYDIPQASKIFERSRRLPYLLSKDIPEFCMHEILSTFSCMLKQKSPVFAKLAEHRSDPLEAFIKMAESFPQIKSVVAFFEISEATLANNLEDLPIIFWGLKYLLSRMQADLDGVELWLEPLLKLMSGAADIYHHLGEVDPFIEEHFERQENGDNFSYIIDMSHLTFGLLESERAQSPLFEFLPNLSLSRKSILSLASAIVKESYSLCLGLLCAQAISEKYAEGKIGNIPLPDNPVIFIQAIIDGFSSQESNFIQRSKLLLSKYLTIKPPLYPIERGFIDWAIFCVFALEPPSLSRTILDEEIERNYPIAESLRKSFESFQKKLPKNSYSIIDDRVHRGLAVRDVLLASQRHRLNLADKTISISGNESLPSLFDISRSLFGWRMGESFEDWGKRLNNEQKRGVGGKDIHLLNHVPFVRDLKPEGPGVEGRINDYIRSVFGLFLCFMQQFQLETSKKNAFINDGGNEENPSEKYRDWHSRIDESLWRSVIVENKPEKYPGFSQLNQDQKNELRRIINKKHGHVIEVQDLKKKCQLSKNHRDWKESVEILIAILISNAETSNRVNIYVQNEEQAVYVYQLLFEISCDRLFRNAIVQNQMRIWRERNRKKLEEELIQNEKFRLSRLIGKFHGPESHLSGEAPIHRHYNAGLVTSKLNITNVHIYFGND